MNKRTKALVGAALAAALTAGTLGGLVSAQAASDAPWQSASAKSPNAVGSIKLYSSAGTQVTSGAINQPFAAYAVGSKESGADGTVASLALYTPVAGASTANPAAADAWSGIYIAAPTEQKALPAFASGPTVDLSSSATVEQYLSAFANKVTKAGYVGAYELRLSTATPGQTFNSLYRVLDIQVTGNRWELYAGGSSTTPEVSAKCSAVTVKATAAAKTLATAQTRAAAATKALTAAAKPGSVKAWLQAQAGLAKAQAAAKAAKTPAKKKSTKAALAKATKALAAAKKKAGKAATVYTLAVTAKNAAAKSLTTATSANAAAAKEKAAACK